MGTCFTVIGQSVKSFVIASADPLLINPDRKGVDQDKLAEIIALGESTTIEFKRSVTSDLGREICAFANSSGGKILLGVSDNGDIVGISDSNRLKSQIQNIARSADPSISIEIERLEPVYCIKIPPQRGKPFSFRGKFYSREGPNSQQMSRDEVRRFFDKEGLIHFDEDICRKFSLDTDLDEKNWDLFRTRANIPAEMAPETALRNLNLINEDSQVTNAGAWLLAKDIRKCNISADISCGLFMGTDKVQILDRRDFHGDIYSMINETMAWILSKINVELIIKQLKREERPELPEEAIREAVVNAFAHRNYRSTANIQIYLFSDRLEIVSPGGLPAGMTEADLGVKSVPRNPLLFNLLYRMNAVEHIGSGIRRIRDLCHRHGVVEPVIKVSENWVTTTFLRSKKPDWNPDNWAPEDFATTMPSEKTLKNQIGAVSEQDSPQVGTKSGLSRDQVGTKSGPSRDQVGTKSGLSRDQVELIRKCENEKPAEELMQAIGRSNRSKFREKILRPLMKAGLLEMTIPDKPRSRHQRYRLTDEGKDLLESLP